MKHIKFVALLALTATLTYIFWPSQDGARTSNQSDDLVGAELVSVVVPQSLSANAAIGQRAYNSKCANCHANNGAGQNGVAPPLIHKIYEPNHHGDEAFQRAAALGVKSHHWPFGDMPPVEGLTRGDIKMIVTYIREVQRENGIF